MTGAAPLFLCYGKVAAPATARRIEGAAVAARGGGLGRQVALIGAETPPFRLNSPGWMDPPPELVAALDTPASLRTLVRDRLLALVPGFAPQVRAACTAWLDAAEAAAGPCDDTLAATQVSQPADRAFAALLPLPAVRIALPSDPDRFVALDLAFWDGARLTALRLAPDAGLLPRQRRALADLETALGPRLRLIRAEGDDPLAALPADLREAWRTAPEPIPGPYRPAALRAPLPA